MAASDRAINLPIRIQGVSEAVAGFRQVGQAGEQSIASIAKAAAAQAQYETALAASNAGAEAYAAAQAEIRTATAQSAAQFKAGEISAEAYATAVLQGKNSLAAAKAEYGVLSTNLAASSKEMVQARIAANDLDPALGKTGAQTNNMRMAQLELGHVVRSSTDAIAAGAAPLQVMSYEASRVVSAVSLMSGGTSKFGEFMAGPWGLAITAGTLILTNLVAKFLASKDATADAVEELKKHAEATRTSEEAQKIFALSTEGVTEALRDEQKALNALNQVQETAAETAHRLAFANDAAAKSTRDRTKAELEAAKSALDTEINHPSSDVYAADTQGVAILALTRQRDTIQAQLDKDEANAAKAEAQLADSRAKLAVERATASPEDKIKQQYDAQIDALTTATVKAQLFTAAFIKDEQAKTEYIRATNAELAKQAGILEARKQAALKEYQAGQQVSNAQSGREVTPDQAAAIARAAGLQVNSSSRTYEQQKQLYDRWVAQGKPADNPVAAPGTSAHEGAKGRWALDIQFGQGVTPELLRKVFAEQGINLTKVFEERGHFHIEGSRSQADSADAAADKQAQKEDMAKSQFDRDLAGLQGKELESYRQLIVNADVRDQNQKAVIDTEKRKKDAELDAFAKAHPELATEVEGLKEINAAQADLAKQLVDRATAERHFQEQQAEMERTAELATAKIESQQQALQGQEDLAKTQKERRDIEHRLIDLQFQEERIQNDLVISKAEELKAQETATKQQKKDADLAIAKAQLRNGSIDQRQTDAVARSDQQTAGPLEAYFRSQPRTADEINERAEGYVVDELEAVRKGIGDALSSAIGVKDPLISGLIDLLVQSLLIDPLTEILKERSAAGGGGGGGGLGGLLKTGLSLLGPIFGGGITASGLASIAPAVGATIAANPAIFASGTEGLPIGAPFYVGENGRERMTYLGGDRVRVESNQAVRRSAQQAGGTTVINNHIRIPERADPRRTQSTVNRGTQRALALSARKGVAA